MEVHRTITKFILLCHPRSGSTALGEILQQHRRIIMKEELLNPEFEADVKKYNSPIDYLRERLVVPVGQENTIPKKINPCAVGFKVFPEQLVYYGLSLSTVCSELDIQNVFILWRKNIFKTVISLEIALRTKKWYLGENEDLKENKAVKFTLDINTLIQHVEQLKNHWIDTFKDWPLGIIPTFLTYEELFPDYLPVVQSKIYLHLGINSQGWEEPTSTKQSSVTPYKEQIENWDEIVESFPKNSLDFEEMFRTVMDEFLGVRGDVYELLPDKEPKRNKTLNNGKWVMQVGSPYLPEEAKDKVKEALETGMVSSGTPYVDELSDILRRMYGCEVAQPCSSGFSALLLALQLADIGKGDEVIVPAFTMIAVANAVHFLGARPIFVDCDPTNKYNPGWQEIERASTKKVKAVIICHIYGVPASNMEQIKKGCDERGWKLIEDISEVVGITFNDDPNRLLGTVGDFASASLYANKIVHAADGGFVLAKHDGGINKRRLRSLVNHGFTEDFHFVHYENAINAKINGLGAALACGIIPKTKEVIQHHSTIAATYRHCLHHVEKVTNDLKTLPQCGYYDSPWVFGVECKSKEIRRQLRKFLADNGIETRDYFFPLHLQPAFKTDVKLRLKVSEEVASTGLYLPNHSNMTTKDASYIADLINHFFKEASEELKNQPTLLAAGLYKDQPTQNLSTENPDKNEEFQIRVSEIMSRFNKYLINECWSDKHFVLTAIEEFKHNQLFQATTDSSLLAELDDMVDYLKCQTHEWLPRDIPHPWLQVDVTDKILFPRSNQIPTTSKIEIRQLLAWAIQEYKPQNVLEIGCLFGHSVELTFESSTSVQSMTAICEFVNHSWMKNMFPNIDFPNNDLLPMVKAYIFKENLEKIRFISTRVESEALAKSDEEWMKKQKFDFVLIDSPKTSKELEQTWNVIEKSLIPKRTIILLNGLTTSSIKFLTEKSNVLQPIAKPQAKAKLFMYLANDISHQDTIRTTTASDNESEEDDFFELLPRQLDMSYDPEWNHHHQNAFSASIERVKAILHHDDAPVKFISATEQYICCANKILQTPWVGMIHNVVHLPGMFYVPDLERLCTPKYAPWFKSCKGLFTLTTFQREYLKQNLLPTLDVKFPILTLKYPFIEPIHPKEPSPFLDETYLTGLSQVNVVLIGSFERDFQYFYKVEMPKFCQKVLLVGEDDMKKEEANCKENNVKLLPRADDKEYEILLQNSIVFLSLKQDGAANTIVLEAIARNIPIVVPDLSSVTEYIGEDYPLLYTPGQPSLVELIQPKNLKGAVEYLTKKLDKTHLTVEHFVQSFLNSSIIRYLPAFVLDKYFDVTVSIISYRRTHHIEKILDSLWNKQTFAGRIQILIWNNNIDRAETMARYCNHYIRNNNRQRNLELIQSTGNHFAAIRYALPPLVKSERILICDDDIIPGPEFIQFFMENNSKHPEDILCVRGHYFKHHTLPEVSPELTWKDYDYVRFADDSAPEQLIHFVHSDVCLMPRKSLMEIAGESMPDKDFDLVDDYWASFIANSKYGRNLRKLSTVNHPNLFKRTDDSNAKGIAMHQRADVFDTRIRHYVHHMLQNWPKVIDTEASLMSINEEIRAEKEKAIEKFLQGKYIGFNISSTITIEEINLLKSWKVKYVRVGSVCSSGRHFNYEFSNLNAMNEDSERYLNEMLDKLKDFGVVITLDERVAHPEQWMFIANICNKRSNVIAYDLINEPVTRTDKHSNFLDVSYEGVETVMKQYKAIIQRIREVDDATFIVLEPTFFGMSYALDFMTANNFLSTVDPIKKLIMSIHFYEPSALTTLRVGMEFPGDIAVYPYSKTCKDSEYWDEAKVKERIKYVQDWSIKNNIHIFIGEFGIGRNVVGANKYLRAVLEGCHDSKISCFLYAFRDRDWERMDYEYGLQKNTGVLERNPENSLMTMIRSFIHS